MQEYTFADLFSGAGGMSCGFKRHGAFTPLFAVDGQFAKPTHRRGSLSCNETYRSNIGIDVLDRDMFHYTPEELSSETKVKPGEIDVLISCAPCTGFSRTLRKNHLEDDERNSLVGRTGDYVKYLRPKILIMENARELLMGNFSHHAKALARRLKSYGYSFCGEVHMLSDFGLPQVRERALIIATHSKIPLIRMSDLWDGWCPKPEALTVRHAISHLPAISAGETHPDDPDHATPSFASAITLRRLQAIPCDGGSWADIIHRSDADELLIPSMKRYVKRGDFGSHPDVYGRMAWDKPAPTIKRECAHVGNGRYSHPEQDRLCSVREMGFLNGFPADYRFVSKSLANKYRHIGDAVPPLISFQLACLCEWMLSGKKPRLESCIIPGCSLFSTDIQRVAQGSLFSSQNLREAAIQH